MCCLVLASESGPRLSLDHDWVWIVTESGSWLSLDRDWVWIVIITWLIEPGSWTWLIVPGSWRIEVSCWTIEIVSSFRVPGGLPSLLIFENPSLEEEDNPGSVTCGVWRRGIGMGGYVTKDYYYRINKTLTKPNVTMSALNYQHLINYWSTMMTDCCHECRFLTIACTLCLNQIHPRLKWLYGPAITSWIYQGFIWIWLKILLFLDRCMILFICHIEVIDETTCMY